MGLLLCQPFSLPFLAQSPGPGLPSRQVFLDHPRESRRKSCRVSLQRPRRNAHRAAPSIATRQIPLRPPSTNIAVSPAAKNKSTRPQRMPQAILPNISGVSVENFAEYPGAPIFQRISAVSNSSWRPLECRLQTAAATESCGAISLRTCPITAGWLPQQLAAERG